VGELKRRRRRRRERRERHSERGPSSREKLSSDGYGPPPPHRTAPQIAIGGQAPAVPAGLPPSLARLLESCLRIKPEERPGMKEVGALEAGGKGKRQTSKGL
jgi:hypothetical protein